MCLIALRCANLSVCVCTLGKATSLFRDVQDRNKTHPCHKAEKNLSVIKEALWTLQLSSQSFTNGYFVLFSFSWCVQKGKSDKEVRGVAACSETWQHSEWREMQKGKKFGPKLFSLLSEKIILPEYWKCHYFNKFFFMLCYQIKGEDHLKCKLNVNAFSFHTLSFWTFTEQLCFFAFQW